MSGGRGARRSAALVLLSLTAVVGAACSVGESITYPPATEPAAPGGVLSIGIVEPASIDPALAADLDGQLVVSTMCDPFVEIDAATGDTTAGMSRFIVPDDSGASVTITLKDDLRFSDGKRVSVSDVRASLSRMASDTLASPIAEEIRPIAGFQFVHGDPPPEGAEPLDLDDPARTSLLGVLQVTSKVFSVGVIPNDPEFVLRLARPWATAVPTRLALGAQFGRQPVCVGPYRLAAPWDPASGEILLERNPFYKGTNEIYTTGGRGYPDRIRFRTYRDRDAVHAAFLRGDVDIARVELRHMGGAPAGARLITAPASAVEYVGMPTSVGFYTDARTRRALSMALDRKALIQRLGRPDRVPATGLLPPTMPKILLERPACQRLAPDVPDVAGAQALMAEAGIDLRGQELPLYFNDEPGSGNKELMEAVGAQWQAAFGLVPRLVPLGWDEYRQRGVGSPGFDAPFRTSWRSPTPAPSTFLRTQLGGSGVGSTNLTRFSEPRFEDAYNRGLERETDPEVRERLLTRIVDLTCDEAPMAPIWVGTQSFLVRDSVGSAVGSFQRAATGDLNVRELYVKGAAAG